MKKFLTMFMVVSSLTFGISIPAFAADGHINVPVASVAKQFVSYKTRTIGSSKQERRFVKYLTSSWVYAEKYTWSESQSSSLSFSGSLTLDMQKAAKLQLGLTNSKTYTFAVATQIPADSSRRSRLAFDCEFNCQDIEVDEIITSKILNFTISQKVNSTSASTYYEPTENSYLYVKYN